MGFQIPYVNGVATSVVEDEGGDYEIMGFFGIIVQGTLMVLSIASLICKSFQVAEIISDFINSKEVLP